ncbi:MAG: GreA/GreB family elongation factor [Candidatus Shikimatogenerans sp. JK-2022]|nr:GreA/GreB family elongation factor [Candidatus Shikimatogenerans bostrichidophilus]
MEYISKKFFQKIKKKISSLEEKKKKIIKEIKNSLQKGDLSENYEYISAKESYEILLNKINNYKKILLNSKIIKKIPQKKNKINIFTKIFLKNLENNKIKKFTIVSNSEANINKKKISIDSPLVKILKNKKEGNIITINKKLKYKILKIN